MCAAIDADDLLHDAGDRSDVVRDDDDGHAPIEFLQRAVQFLFETVVHEVRRFVQNQQFRVGDYGPAQQRPLHLSSRHFADRFAGRVGDPGLFEQGRCLRPVLFRVARAESAASLQPGEHDFLHRDREGAVEIRNLGHVSDQPLSAAEQLGSVADRSRVGNRSQNGLHERRFAASVRTDDAQEVVLPDLQIDVLEGFVPVVCDAYVAQCYQCHCGRTIKSVIESMLAIASSRSGSISVHSAPMSRAMVSTTDTGN